MPVQNLWLAARAESIGVGWVSILDTKELKALLGITRRITPVAYLCIGYVSEFLQAPELEQRGWESRESLAKLIHFNHWGMHDERHAAALVERINDGRTAW